MIAELINKLTGHKASIDKTGAVFGINRAVPPHSSDSPQSLIPFVQHFTDDGTESGSEDMQVDGSTTPVDFFIPAQQDADLWVSSLSFVMADTGGALNEFIDTGSPLANGVQLLYNRGGGEEIIIHSGLQTNFDFFRLAQAEAIFATGTNPFRVNNAVAAAEAFIPVINLNKSFNVPFGIRLTQGSKQRFTIRIQDDLTIAGISQFDCLCFAVKREPDE